MRESLSQMDKVITLKAWRGFLFLQLVFEYLFGNPRNTTELLILLYFSIDSKISQFLVKVDAGGEKIRDPYTT